MEHKKTLFERQDSPAARPQNGGMAIATGRSAQEAQAAMVMAKQFPRDQVLAFSAILRSCERLSLAEAACYAYPRGERTVTGPSIRLAESLAQHWGNIEFGVIELDQADGESSVMAFAWDLESNTRQTKIFRVPHLRRSKKQEIKLTDPRDIYELVANNGARRLRACILGVIPGDIVEAAVEQCEKTIAKGGGEPLQDRARDLASAFSRLGVTAAMVEARLGHSLGAIAEQELVGLRKILTAIKDGYAKRDAFFPIKVSPADVSNKEPHAADDDVPMRFGKKSASKKKAAKEKHKSSPPQPAAPGSTDVEKLALLCVSHKITEEQLLAWAKDRKHIGPTIASIAKAALAFPKKIRVFVDKFETIKTQIQGEPI